MKRHKDPVSASTKPGEAQVFVLPPDLLEKLGIQLSNITCPAEGLTDNAVGQSTIDNKEPIINAPSTGGNGSSILETANLMKQSVFMSPTFVSAATENTNEVNLHNFVTVTQESIQGDQFSANDTDKYGLNRDINPRYNEIVPSKGFEKYQSIKEYEVENGDLILSNKSYDISNDANIDPISIKSSSVDDHADEAYSSDGSNSISETCSVIINNLNAALKPKKSSNKIKILSEEIINDSDLNTIKDSRIQKISSSCFLIPVDTIVTGKTKKDRFKKQLQNKPEQEEICSSTTEKKSKMEKEIENMDATKILVEKIVEDTTINVSTEPEIIKQEPIHIIRTMGSDNKSEIVFSADNIKLNAFMDVSKDEKLKLKTQYDTSKDLVSNTEKSSSKSKLCIQGVEKPGGTNENKTDPVHKTYQRTNIQKHIPDHVELLHLENMVDSFVLPDNVAIDLDNINMDGYKNADKFCICSDFGLLADYDSDIVYEHLHFCDHNSVGCNLETLFSIYEDTSVSRELNLTENIELVDNVIETTKHNICWLSFLYENSIKTEDSDIIEPTVMDESNSSPDQPRRSNRKRKSTATEHVTESVELTSDKNTVKCGTCGLILAEAEWNKHKETEHNLIAWKDGQTIVKQSSTAIHDESQSKDVLESSKLTPLTRRSSRNLGIDVSEISIDNTSRSKIKHNKVVDIEKSVSKEQKKSPSLPKIKSVGASSNLVEKECITSKSVRKSVDVITPKSTSNILEDSLKSNNITIGVVSSSKSKVKALDVERPTKFTRQSKTSEGTPKSTGESTPKSTKISLDLSLSEVKVTPKAEMTDTPKFSRKRSDDSTKDIKQINISKLEDMVSTKSFDDSTETSGIKKEKIKITTKSTNLVASKISETKILSSESFDLMNESSLPSKTNTKPIDDAGHPKSTAKDVDENRNSSKSNLDNTNTASKSINKSTSKSVEAIGVSAKPALKQTNVETPSTSTRKLKEVDLFSSPTTKTKTESQNKSTKQSRDVIATSKLPNVEIAPKPSPSKKDEDLIVSSKQTRSFLKVKDSDKLMKKSIDADILPKVNRKDINAEQKDIDATISLTSTVKSPAESDRKSIDVHVRSKVLRQYTRDKGSKETREAITTSSEENKNNASLKPKIKSENPTSSKSQKRSSKMTESENNSTDTENFISLKSRRSSGIVNIEVPQKQVTVEIEIPALSAKTATADNVIPKSNTPEVDVSAGSVTRNKETRSSSKRNSNKKTSNESSNPKKGQNMNVVPIKEEILPKCGVCKLQVDESQWLEHIAKEHDYLAWKEDESPLNLEDDDELREHLYAIVKANGPLTCSKCNLTRKYAKSFLTHIRSCNGIEEEQSQLNASTASLDTTQDLDDLPLTSYPRDTSRNELFQRSVVCGVCNESVLQNKWIDHIRMEHKYLAWKKGEPALDLEDEVAVKIFLQNISKYNGGLMCSKCGTVRLYVKKWVDHEATCKGNEADKSLNGTMNESTSREFIEFEVAAQTVKCAKCGEEMPGKSWIDHIEKHHNYLSWVEGQPPLDESNPEAVSAYLFAMVRKLGELICAKCGVTRKYPKAFITHISACEISGFKREDFYVEVSGQTKPGEYECAVCHRTGPRSDWKKHAMSEHYNVAWMAGDFPINLKNPYAVEKYIKEYRMKHNLVCKVCGASRASCYGFYAHILTCGKTEEELEHLMDMCDICNNKFLCIYRNQHKAMHKEQMLKKMQKEMNAIKAEEEIIAKAKAKEGGPMGKRRAAEKAKKVMEKYTSNIQDGNNVCPVCHIEFDSETLLKDHECQGSKLEDGSDSDVSVKMEGQEESDDDMEVVDSSISDEEGAVELKRKRQHETIPKITLPFKVRDFSSYLAKSFDDFCELHYTRERLFSNWPSNDYKILSEDESEVYLPSLTESCKLRVLDDQWETFKRFEAKKIQKDATIFTGAGIRCMQWAPQRLSQESQDQYLAVVCFRDADCPRYGKDELPGHPGMLQIWNMGQFLSLPKFEMGLAHDYGTIWGMDWCPSGGRDDPAESEEGCRLGLLAIACSNGCAYILSVPRFNTEAQDKPIIIKLKPAAELRLSVNPKQPPFRMSYQATSISWSPQKGHDVVVVGYADGTTAMYDLNTKSLFLKATEDGVDIFYPFQDSLAENSSISGVALCASQDLRRVVGGVASASVTGATMAGWPRGPLVRSHLAASSVSYTPNWPAALLCSDDVLTMKSTNEMEWWGGGRRLGGACAAAACARCGRLCLAAPPFVRVLRAHPVYPELKKQIVATLKMVPIARKRKFKLVNDDLGMIVEPLTYDEAIKKYGLEFKMLPKKDRNVASKLCDNAEQRAERFPLSDMPAAAFCPSIDHHNRLAVASHSGLIFIITI